MKITKTLAQSMESSYGESGEDTTNLRGFYPAMFCSDLFAPSPNALNRLLNFAYFRA